MLGLGIRRAVKSRVRGAIDRARGASGPARTPAGPPAARAPEVAPVQVAAPAAVPTPPAVARAVPTGAALTREAVEAVLDEMVRPALQSDGGDITLVDVVDGDIHVRLVGSCASCPSSIATVRGGVERLLAEEFPSMRDLVQVP